MEFDIKKAISTIADNRKNYSLRDFEEADLHKDAIQQLEMLEGNAG